jgi:hypothetical protein
MKGSPQLASNVEHTRQKNGFFGEAEERVLRRGRRTGSSERQKNGFGGKPEGFF